MPSDKFPGGESAIEKKEPLLLSQGERPASVFFKRGEVRIDLHDTYHKYMFRRLKADIVALHPDKARVGFRRRRKQYREIPKSLDFIKATTILNRWVSKEEKWYAQFGLKPPRVTGMADVDTFVYKRVGPYISPTNPKYMDKNENSGK